MGCLLLGLYWYSHQNLTIRTISRYYPILLPFCTKIFLSFVPTILDHSKTLFIYGISVGNATFSRHWEANTSSAILFTFSKQPSCLQLSLTLTVKWLDNFSNNKRNSPCINQTAFSTQYSLLTLLLGTEFWQELILLNVKERFVVVVVVVLSQLISSRRKKGDVTFVNGTSFLFSLANVTGTLVYLLLGYHLMPKYTAIIKKFKLAVQSSNMTNLWWQSSGKFVCLKSLRLWLKVIVSEITNLMFGFNLK